MKAEIKKFIEENIPNFHQKRAVGKSKKGHL